MFVRNEKQTNEVPNMKMFIAQMFFVDANETLVMGVFSTHDKAVDKCVEASNGLEGTDTVLSVHAFEVDSAEQLAECEWQLDCEGLTAADEA
jgi:hypothetical protein